MIGFFLKKAFFDGWDNLFAIAAFNIIHLVILLLFIVLPISLGIGNALSMIFIIVGFMAIAQWQSITAFAMNGVSDYHAPGFRATFAHFSSSWKPGLVVGAVNVALWFSVTVGIPFYLSQSGILGLFLASLLFWTCFIALLASQYYLPLEARRGGGFRKSVRVAMILVLDNPGFSLFLFLYNLFSLVISTLMAFMAPGLAGIALASADAVKLRLLKYDWLEKNPGVNKKHLPWTDILEEEKEMVGERTLKGMIFPWKEGK